MKRQRSNLSYWLRGQGAKAAYDNLNNAKKNEFLVNWFADKVKKLEGENKLSSIRSLRVQSQVAQDHEWMSKETIYQRLGPNKGQAQIDSGTLETRADQATGKHGEFLTEYKIYFGRGSESETKTNDKNLSNEQKITDEARAKEILDHVESIAENIAGVPSATSSGSTDLAPVEVKVE
eukprot:4831-Pyramimonas_sp.AAC.1